MSRGHPNCKPTFDGSARDFIKTAVCFLAIALLTLDRPPPAQAQGPAPGTVARSTATAPNPSALHAPSGLPLPRFVSLRANQVNMRSGPGKRYPVVWIFHRRGVPVEIVAEYDTWRKIRDPEGSEGWVHKNMLSGQRTLITKGRSQFLRAEPSPESNPIAQTGPGVVGKLLSCPSSVSYCRVDVGGYLGWLPRDSFWGVYKGEFVE